MPGRPAVTGVRKSIPIPKLAPFEGVFDFALATYWNRVRPKTLSDCNPNGKQDLSWPKVLENSLDDGNKVGSYLSTRQEDSAELPRPVSQFELLDR